MKLQLLTLLLSAAPLLAQKQVRPPATPLITHNPYFSIWSDADKLTDANTVHWTGKPQPITGLVHIDGHAFRFMGHDPRSIPAMQQTSLTVTPTHTRYTFTAAGVELDLSFFSPTILSDLDILSRPVTYVSFTVKATDGATHNDISVVLDVNPLIAVNAPGESVTFSRNQTETQTVLSVGSRDQRILNRSGDDLRIDWGYFHLSVPKDEESTSAISPDAARTFAGSGHLPASDDMDQPQIVGRDDAHLAVELPFHTINAEPQDRHLLVSYTEGYAIQYLERNLRPWWQRNGQTVPAMLDAAEREMPALEQRGNDLDTNLTADLVRTAGLNYANLCILAYRQAWAAHGFVADLDGSPLVFGKENFSNGSIGTVDVLYPAAPLFLFFNPVLLEAELRPLMEYTALPNRWRFPFAPHDLGTYPARQRPNLRRRRKDRGRPDARRRVRQHAHPASTPSPAPKATQKLAAQYWPKLTQWAEFLKAHGLDPENQLTTDDFAGHVTHNANLALKAIDALEAYADLAKLLGKNDVARDYSKTAHDLRQEVDRPGQGRRSLQARLRLSQHLEPEVQPRLGSAARLQPLPPNPSARARSPSTKPKSTSTVSRSTAAPTTPSSTGPSGPPPSPPTLPTSTPSWISSPSGSTRLPAASPSPTGTTPKTASRSASRPARSSAASSSRRSPTNNSPTSGARRQQGNSRTAHLLAAAPARVAQPPRPML